MQFFTRHTCVFNMSTKSQAPWWRILPKIIVIHTQLANPKSATHQFVYVYTAMHSVMWRTPWAASGSVNSNSSVSHTALHSWCPMLQTHYALPARAEWDLFSKVHSTCTNTFIISTFHMTYFMNFAIWKISIQTSLRKIFASWKCSLYNSTSYTGSTTYRCMYCTNWLLWCAICTRSQKTLMRKSVQEQQNMAGLGYCLAAKLLRYSIYIIMNTYPVELMYVSLCMYVFCFCNQDYWEATASTLVLPPSPFWYILSMSENMNREGSVLLVPIMRLQLQCYIYMAS